MTKPRAATRSAPAAKPEAAAKPRPAAKPKAAPKPRAAKVAAPRNPGANIALVNASSRGDLAAVKRALAAGASVSSADAVTGYTALHHAAAQGHLAMIELLLEAGAPVEAPLRNARSTPLCCAVSGNHHAAVEALLRAGAKTDLIHGRIQATPLHDAAMGEDPRSVELLLAAGASPDLPSKGGLTALQQVVRMAGSLDRAAVTAIVRALLAAGADRVRARRELHPDLDASDPDLGYLLQLL
jgi:ankyrin repeat protein